MSNSGFLSFEGNTHQEETIHEPWLWPVPFTSMEPTVRCHLNYLHSTHWNGHTYANYAPHIPAHDIFSILSLFHCIEKFILLLLLTKLYIKCRTFFPHPIFIYASSTYPYINGPHFVSLSLIKTAMLLTKCSLAFIDLHGQWFCFGSGDHIIMIDQYVWPHCGNS